MRRALLAVMAMVGVLAPVAATPAVAADGVNWQSLPYYAQRSDANRGYTFMYVPTNAALWHAGRVTNQFTSMPFQVTTPEQYNGHILETVWAAHCSTAAQRVTFSRQVSFAGTPKKVLTALALDITDPSSLKGHPLAWAELRVNGAPVERIEGTKARPLRDLSTWHARNVTAVAAAAFHYGANTLTVVAQKRHTGANSGYCRRNNTGFGVLAEIYAEAEHDLTTETIRHTETDHAVDVTIRVANTGPTDVVPDGGTFYFSTGKPTGDATVTGLSLTSPAGDCTTTAGSQGEWTAACPIGRIRVGGAVDIGVHVDLQKTACNYTIPLSYYAFGLWTDPNRKNDSKQGSIYCDGTHGA